MIKKDIFDFIGKRIKSIRVSKEITQAELAEAIDISETYVSYIECAQKHPSISILIDIADALGVEISDIICTVNEEPNSDIEEILRDCNDYEKNIITDTVQALKRSLRNNRTY